MKLNPNLKAFWQTKADVKVLKGGRASSKTWDTAGFAIFLAANYTVKFLCMRQFQNKIQESVYAILKIQIENFGMEDEFDILKTTITHKKTGSTFHFYGIHRNITEIKGFEGADIGWIEEGEGLTKEQWEIIEPTLRKEGAEAWILFNPRLVSDFSLTFKHDPKNGIIVRHINYNENPFLSATMHKKIEKMKATDRDAYDHIYLGIPRSDNDDSVIKRSWIEAAIDAHKKLGIEVSGKHRLGFDIADDGDDTCATVLIHGILAEAIDEWKANEDELNKSSARAYNTAKKVKADIVYDSIGVGASAGSNFKQFNRDSLDLKLTYSKFNAGDAVQNPTKIYGQTEVKNKEFFSNLKAQAWWTLADRLKTTYNAVTKGEEFDPNEIISISSSCNHLSRLVDELSTPMKDFDGAGKVKVESKKDLKKRNVASPNLADAFVMGYYQDNKINYGNLL